MHRNGFRLEVNLLQQILYNIFVNACKFNKPRGSIGLRFDILESVDPSQKVRMQITVTDTGIGIKSEQKKHLFKLFDSVKKD
mmetsp:Transcript_24361/g.37735  ORF Transcript_24361/g.37735 Transcript_24361/m.37735 type:complete len:82 (-) Transcript_24361:2527-2772(-)